MKKIILSIIIITSLLFQIEHSFAEDSGKCENCVNVRVTEEIPWVECKPVKIVVDWGFDKWWREEIIPNLYDCKVKKWASQIVEMLGNIIKYFTFIVSLVWVLFIVYNGILYSMWWADPSLKDDAKKRIIWTLIWLILLLLSGPILQLIAPWIYK